MTSSSADIDKILSLDVDSMNLGINQSSMVNDDEKFESNEWKDNGPWLVIPLLLIVASAFRRGWILSLLIFALPLTPGNALAFGWENLWLRADQQAARNFKAEYYDQIPDDAPIEWRGAAKYRSGDFGAAVRAYTSKNTENASTQYNRGNALALTGAFQESITAYKNALDIDPAMEDARFNKILVEKLLKEQNEQSSSPDDSNQQSSAPRKNGNDSKTGGPQGDQQIQQESSRESKMEDSEVSQSRSLAAENRSDQTPDEATSGSAEPKPGQGQAATQIAEKNKNLTALQDVPMSEQQQALEQWLQRIPDDPGGLLRRKFSYQYSLRRRQPPTQPW